MRTITETITTTVYKFDELSDSAKERACQQIGDSITSDDLWYESVFEDFIERAASYGVTYRLCPACYDKNMTCHDCGKCWKKDRKEVIVFPAHGYGKKKTRDFLMDL